MLTPNATITLFNKTFSAVVSADGIVDTDGNAVNLDDIVYDVTSQNFTQNGKIVGHMSEISASTLSKAADLTASAPRSTGGAAAAASTPILASSSDGNSGVTPMVGEGLASPEGTMGGFRHLPTATMVDGGARTLLEDDVAAATTSNGSLTDPSKTPLTTTTTPTTTPITTTTGTGTGTGTTTPPPTTTTTTITPPRPPVITPPTTTTPTGPTSTVNPNGANPNTYVIPTAVTPSTASRVLSTANTVVGGLNALGQLGGKFGFLKTGVAGKILGPAGIALGGVSAFQAAFGMGQNGLSKGGFVNLAMAVGSVYLGAAMLGSAATTTTAIAGIGTLTTTAASGSLLTNIGTLFAVSNPWGWVIIGSIILAAYLIGRSKRKDNEIDTEAGDVAALPNTIASQVQPTTPPTTTNPAGILPTWATNLAGNFGSAGSYVIAGLATLMIGTGIDFTATAPLNQVVEITAPEVPAAISKFNSAMQTHLAKEYGNLQLPSNPLGSVFIQKGDGVSIADKVVFMDQNSNGDGSYRVNAVSLNPGGYMISEQGPTAMIPFFMRDPGSGQIRPTPEGDAALSAQTAMARAANTAGMTPAAAATAAQLGASRGHPSEVELR